MKGQLSIRRESILTDIFPYFATISNKLHSVLGLAKQLGQNICTLSSYIYILKAMFMWMKLRLGCQATKELTFKMN